MRRMLSAFLPLEDRVTPAGVGQLDPTFGTTGAVTPNVVLNIPNATTPTVIGRQSDGKVIIGSTAYYDGGDSDFAIYRLDTDGFIDTTFGTGGLTTVAFDLGGNNADVLTALKVTSDNRIVAVGYADRGNGDFDYAVTRLTATGQPDNTFDGDGNTVISFDLVLNGVDKASAVTVASNGRIVVAGSVQFDATTDFDFGIAQLTSAGKLDVTFSGDGRSVVGFDQTGSNRDDRATGVAFGVGETSVVVVGTANKSGANTDAAVTRLTSAGDLDTTFNGTGRRIYAIDNSGTNGENTAEGVVVLADGRIVIAGTVAVGTGGNTDFYAGRLKTDGTPDPTFGANGFVAAGLSIGGAKIDRAAALAVDPLGRVLIAGSVQISATDYDFGLVRLSSGGVLDPSFDFDGGMQIPFDKGGTEVDTVHGLALQPDGRILISGTATTATGAQTAAARVYGTIGLPSALAIGGIADGSSDLFLLDSNNKYITGPTDTIFPNYAGPVRTAVGDVDGDGVSDIAYGIGPNGGSLLRVVNGATGEDLLPATPSYEAGFNGGIFVAAADIDGDGKAEIAVSPDVGGGARIQIFSIVNQAIVSRDNFFGIGDTNFRGGARIALGDINDDGRLDIVVGAGFGGGPRVAIYDGAFLLSNIGLPPKVVGDFFAFPGPDAVTLRNGVYVAVGDLSGDGFADLIFGGGPGGGPRVYAISGALVSSNQVAAAQAAPVANFFTANDVDSRGGVRVAVRDIDDDHRADLITGSGDGLPSDVRVYLGTSMGLLQNTESPGALWQNFDPYGISPANGVFVG